MGNSNSKRARIAASNTSSRQFDLGKFVDKKTSDSSLTDVEDGDLDAFSGINIAALSKWESKLLSDPKNRLALGVLTTQASTAALLNPAAVLKDTHLFNTKIELEGSPVTNQRQSGRCWLFASTNVFRVGMMRKYKLSGFEFSQSYLFFWDKLEKANFFLEQIIDTANEPLDGRLVQYLLNAPVGDGGQWDMVVNLVEKYGLVPQGVYPDAFSSKASSRMNWLITAKLREAALVIRHMINAQAKDGEKGSSSVSSNDILQYKASIVRDIYGILALSLGVPPKPDDKFTWNYLNKESKFNSVTTTPLEFYRDNVGAVSFPTLTAPASKIGLSVLGSEKGGVSERLSLVNDPRNAYMTHLTVGRLGNVHGARGIQYINVDMAMMKASVIAMLKANNPVFFGCDVGKFSDASGKGIMDTDLFNYELGFNITLNMSKEERLLTGESQMTHAMVISGVHLEKDEHGNEYPVKWRVENSWGDASGEKGYLVMADAWMDEYCYQAVVLPEFVSDEVRDVLKQEPKVLPIWDPMGALA